MSKRTEVQSVMFDVKKWTEQRARAWLSTHKFRSGTMERVGNHYRFPQMTPKGRPNFRTIKLKKRDQYDRCVDIESM